MNRFGIFSAIFLFSIFTFSQTNLSKKDILTSFERREKEIRKNVKEIYTETVSYMKIKGNDFTIISKVKDFIDSLSFENITIDNIIKDTLFFSGSFKTTAEKIRMNFNGNAYDLFLSPANNIFSHNLKMLLPDSFMIQREKSFLKIVSLEISHPLIQMDIDVNEMKLKSFQFKSYTGIYTVKIESYKTFNDYLSIPDSTDLFLDDVKFMNSKLIKSKVSYK